MILRICHFVLSSLCGLVFGEEVVLHICSFKPNAPVPINQPITSKPSSKYSSLSSSAKDISFPTISDVSTKDTKIIPATSQLTAEKHIVEKHTTEILTINKTTANKTTTNKQTTTKPKVYLHEDDNVKVRLVSDNDEVILQAIEKLTTKKQIIKKPITEKPVEEKSTSKPHEDSNGVKIRTISDSEEIILHKRLLAGDYERWPKQINDINSLAKEAMNKLLTNYTTQLDGKVRFTRVQTVYKENDIVSDKVYYELKYTINTDNVTTEQRGKWDSLRERLEKNHETFFYDYFSKNSEDVGNYGVCSKARRKTKHVDLKVSEDTPENVTPPSKSVGGEDKPRVENYWLVILIICVGCVLLFGIIIFVSLSNSSKSSAMKELEKSNKIIETVIQIDKIKQENEVIMEGYLLKEGNDSIIGKYQRRYCVLYFNPATLRIYESMIPSYYDKVYVDEKQSIPLECYSGVEYNEGNNEFTLLLEVRYSAIKTFELDNKYKRIYFKVEGENSVETCMKWVECFRDLKNQKSKYIQMRQYLV